ncbi:aldo/keto reductase, partial [Methylobacterium sp. WL116]|uniref:aldo/keto reductase n=1 Tax=Methylobacterium sp. WL116 TaxID=2603889 RepID=UPI001FEFE8D8
MARFFKRTPAAEPAGQDPAAQDPADTAGKTPKRQKLHELQPDPDRIGIAGSVPFVQLPVPADLFANRALRLQLDHIDLYQIHGFDPATPIEETVRALDILVQHGHVRYVGV